MGNYGVAWFEGLGSISAFIDVVGEVIGVASLAQDLPKMAI